MMETPSASGSATTTTMPSSAPQHYLLRGNAVQPQLTGAINMLEHYKLTPLLLEGARNDKLPQTFEPYIRHLPVMGNETESHPELGMRALFRLEEWPIIDDEDDLVLPPLGPELIKGLTLEPGKLEERRRRKKHRDREKGDRERKHRKHRKKHREGADGAVVDGSAPAADGTSAAPTGEGDGERRDRERKHRHKHKRKSREEGAEGGSTKESREERRKKRRKREEQAAALVGADGQAVPPKPEIGIAVPAPAIGS